MYWVAGDGGLYRTTLVGLTVVEQVPSPGDLTRVAVSPDQSVWCADREGRAWTMHGDYNWSRVPVLPNDFVVDVDVAGDQSVWLLTRNGRYYVKRNDASTPQLVPLFITISGVTGVAQPDFNDPEHSAGTAWATTDFGGPGRLMISNGVWEPDSSTFQGITDLSKGSASSENLWMVMADGSIWTTKDGQTRLRMGDLGASIATRVAADYTNIVAYAVSSDGRAWVWQKDVVTSPPPPHPPPPPPPPPPQPGVQAPSLQVTSTGSGQSTVYKMTGSGFVPGAQVHIRAVEITDGQATEIFQLTTADNAGRMAFDLAVPCQPGETFSFSANDGRVQSGDFTQTLWSNTVTLQCQ
ncbi:hypothetical protein ACTIVE_1630 [Actinomadura verrucosospora]|uniref:Uncharacterized protein n=1 Tax=Actinomadura verrucosospora TaxID=46165 RepID=A0A7D3VSU1_ACTVE|nr:hypothetical protein ACTIVE_1630 [Actinomadura verrucosospora]